MKPIEIYNSNIIKETTELDCLLGCWHPHIDGFDDMVDYGSEELDKQTRIVTKFHYNPYIDGERVCTVASVWFDKKPVMIVRNGGRAGHDQYDEFITNEKIYEKMVTYLRTFIKPEETDPDKFVDENKDLKELDYFICNMNLSMFGKIPHAREEFYDFLNHWGRDNCYPYEKDEEKRSRILWKRIKEEALKLVKVDKSLGGILEITKSKIGTPVLIDMLKEMVGDK